MRREHRKRSTLSIKAPEFKPRFRFSTKAKEFVPVREIVRNILNEKLDEELKKKMKILNEELKEELKEKRKELEQIMAPAPFSVNAKVLHVQYNQSKQLYEYPATSWTFRYILDL